MLNRILLLAALFAGCDMLPKKDIPYVVLERNRIMESARTEFEKCFGVENKIDIQFSFKLYRDPSWKEGSKASKPFDPVSGQDEIKISAVDENKVSEVIVDCMKRNLKKLTFQAVYPSIKYMESHSYLMRCRLDEIK